MDDYWVKSGNKELASKKLDDDMDSYWAKKEEGDGDAAEGHDEEGEVGPPHERLRLRLLRNVPHGHRPQAYPDDAAQSEEAIRLPYVDELVAE